MYHGSKNLALHIPCVSVHAKICGFVSFFLPLVQGSQMFELGWGRRSNLPVLQGEIFTSPWQ